MNFKKIIINNLLKEGVFLSGDVIFELVEDSVKLTFYKKEDLPEWLLDGIDKYSIEKANSLEHNMDELISHNISVVENSKQKMVLLCRGSVEKSVDELLEVCYKMQSFYDRSASHITRMFGSYVLISKENDKLEAKYATISPIKYCPLMYKLLKEIGGNIADEILLCLKNGNTNDYQKNMLHLINDIVLKGGGFDSNRPLNTCERNVTFGASEIMSDAMMDGKLDAAVIVSNNLGTVITSCPLTTQGVVKRMSGLFYTSPSPKLIERAFDEGIMPVFPFTGKIDQVEGVKYAIKLGYKNISVSVAASDNKYLKEIANLETEGITLYKFGLCATGITDETAYIMRENADIVWSCASKSVRKIIAPKAIAQVGLKIPVYILTEKGWNLVKQRLKIIDKNLCLEGILLKSGEEMPIIYNNENGGLTAILKKNMDFTCIDCPEPCV